MKKIIAMAAIACCIVSCNDAETNTDARKDSAAAADSAAMNVLDTSKKMMNDVKDLVDSTANKMMKAADKVDTMRK